MELKVLGVAGGNGVILHPFKNDLMANIETRKVFKTPDDIQWRLNFEAEVFQKPLFKTSLRPNVIIGAPDCGHSSVLAFSRAKKMGNPEENESLNNFIESVDYYNPDFFMMENLPKLLSNWGKDIKKIFPKHRLIIFTKPVSAWGNSQMSRVRLVVIGVNRDLPVTYDMKLEKLPKGLTYKTSGQLIKGLIQENPELCNVREPLETEICLYYKDLRKITARRAQELWLGKYRNEKKWPVNRGNLRNQPGIYRNLEQDYPLTARKQNRQFNHHGLMLTPREIARIQGIPDDFKLWFDPSRLGYSLNKARVTTAKTPPYEIGLWFYKTLLSL
jgi:site-specific DNA-cytosine methylase